MQNIPNDIGALANLQKAIPLSDMPEGRVEQVGEDYGVIAQFIGPNLEDAISVFKEGNGYYASGHNFDFFASDIPELMKKLKIYGATELYYGRL